MLQASLGVVADTETRKGFIDFDTAPDEGAPLVEVLRFLLSRQASNLRPLLSAELSYGLDLAFRRGGRRLRDALRRLLQPPRLPLIGLQLPALPAPPLVVPLPPRDGAGADPTAPGTGVGLPRLATADQVLEAILPPLRPGRRGPRHLLRGRAERAAGWRSAAVRGSDFPLPSPQAVLATISALGGRGSEGAPEFVTALREMLASGDTRSALTDEVLAAVAKDLLSTWRARLDAAEL
ncbi:unnamed protein product [Prorocentrum cordatum]|uniref:Uncharacterized protein n=1 Tax=Prorocentrum cordatum TaxID=2364126 RepID=A0ABN9VMG2_9DINO|nr:unnamed protein product [Polarella glacialis]